MRHKLNRNNDRFENVNLWGTSIMKCILVLH